ncbi:hypothetical protein BH18ACT9_BH18ACT9_12720 [soil metagenome]
MKVSGTSTLSADRAEVFRALNDPAVLVASIPGCRRLEALGADGYAMTVAAGVGSIKGVYDGEVRLSEQEEPSSFRMHAQGAGAPGTIGADVEVRLEDAPSGGTTLTYEADATVGGMIGGVGQRMLTGVSKKMAEEFFRNVDSVLASGGSAGLPGEGAAANHPGGPGPSTAATPSSVRPAGSAAGTVFTAPAPLAGTSGGPGFVVGVAVGAAAALAGAVVGAWIAGRRC